MLKYLSVNISSIVTLGYGHMPVLLEFLFDYGWLFVRTVDMHTRWSIPFILNHEEIYSVLNAERMKVESSDQSIANFSLRPSDS